MWIFCHSTHIDGSGEYFSIGFIQGSKGVWVEVTQRGDFDEACRLVNYLNGGNGFPLQAAMVYSSPVGGG